MTGSREIDRPEDQREWSGIIDRENAVKSVERRNVLRIQMSGELAGHFRKYKYDRVKR